MKSKQLIFHTTGFRQNLLKFFFSIYVFFQLTVLEQQQYKKLNINCFDETSLQFNFQKTAMLPLSRFKRTQRKIPIDNAFADYKNQAQNIPTLTYQANKSNDQTFMLNIITTNARTLSRPPIVFMSISDSHFLSNTNNKTFQTNT